MKRFLLLALCPLSLYAKAPLLTDPILKNIDGIHGIFDKAKVEKSLWLITEIKAIHEGTIKINSKGEPDPGRKSTSQDIIFRGKKQTVKELIALENTIESMTPTEREEFEELFLKVKVYFGKCHDIMLADARGAQKMIIKLIEEFCRKYNRANSFLRNWKEGQEAEIYNHDVINFTSFYLLTTDLKNFLAVLIKSCPRAFADFRASRKKS